MCTSDIFSEEGMVGLLEQAVELFKEVYLIFYKLISHTVVCQRCGHKNIFTLI